MTLDGIKLYLSTAYKYVPDFSYEDYKIILVDDVDRLPEKVKPYYITTCGLNRRLMKQGYCLSLELFNVLVGSNLVWDNFIDVCKTINIYETGIETENFSMEEAKLSFSEWLCDYNCFWKIEIADESDYINYFRSLIVSKNVTDEQYNEIKDYVKVTVNDFCSYCSEDAPENYNVFKSLPFYFSKSISDSRVLYAVLTATIEALSENDIRPATYNSLITFILKYYLYSYNDLLHICEYLCSYQNGSFKSIPRSLRKIIIYVLNGICAYYLTNKNNYTLADTMTEVLPYKKQWIKLGEVLHPGDYRVFRLANKFFDIIRNDIKSIKK